MPARDAIAGLVLAGGRGSRMGGVDKGLQTLHGQPLARLALARLQPQVERMMVSANRHAAVYAEWGVPVLADADGGAGASAGTGADPTFDGPLAGLLSGLRHCPCPWMASVPCDTPFFPTDLVQRLASAVEAAGTDAAVAWAPGADGVPRAQPVFCLLHVRLQPSLASWLHGGQRKAMGWLNQHGAVAVHFDDPRAFLNANTLDDLGQLENG